MDVTYQSGRLAAGDFAISAGSQVRRQHGVHLGRKLERSGIGPSGNAPELLFATSLELMVDLDSRISILVLAATWARIL